MNKKIKKIITFTTFACSAMYIFNKVIQYISDQGLTLEENENYYNWRNGTIYYTKKGTGKPLLLIHDLNPISSSYEWNQVIDLLSNDYTVYAIDLLGCGKSDKPAMSYINYLYVELINDFIKDIIKEKTDLLVTGESFTFALMASRMNPGTIDKITAINPTDITYNVQSPSKVSEFMKHVIETPVLGTFIYNLIHSKSAITKQMNQYTFYPTSLPDKLNDIYYETAHLQKNNGKYLYASIIGKYTNINIIHTLKHIDHPIHFISTNQDDANIKKYVEYNPSIKISYIKNAGYLPQIEYPNDIVKLMN